MSIGDIVASISLIVNAILVGFTIREGVFNRASNISIMSFYTLKDSITIKCFNDGKVVAKNLKVEVLKVFDNGEEIPLSSKNVSKNFNINGIDVCPNAYCEDTILYAVPNTFDNFHSFSFLIKVSWDGQEEFNLTIKTSK